MPRQRNNRPRGTGENGQRSTTSEAAAPAAAPAVTPAAQRTRTDAPPRRRSRREHSRPAHWEELVGGFNDCKGVSIAIALFGVVLFVAWNVYLGYWQTRISTPLGTQKVTDQAGLDIPSRFWGTYRPGVYFGMKHRSPKSLTTGLMWIIPSQIQPGNPKLRHLCEQGDNLKKYGWIEHDGVNFGVQEIFDTNLKLTTSFVKREGGRNGGDWTSKITVEPMVVSKKPTDDEVILMYYVALEPGLEGELEPELMDGLPSAVHGNTTELGNFILRFLSGNNLLQESHLVTDISSMNDISDTTLGNIVATRDKGNVRYSFIKQQPRRTENPNLFVYQVHVKAPFSLEVVFETSSFFNRPSMLAGNEYAEALENYRKQFRSKFESTFHLSQKGFNSSAIEFAQATLSNMIGGIGHFHGNSKVQSTYNDDPVSYWPASLYTAVPSRSFFPRGFLWDEGFHLLLINKWNAEISLDIISHWLDLMNVEGWIPREMILGEEALRRVPDEFVVQKNDVANPPTLVIALADLLARHQDWLIKNHKQTLSRMWPRLTTWYDWLNRTQIGENSSTYRWRGRNETTERELNPKTLASGLDDYPRASHPTKHERHLDLRCWMAVTAKLMSDLSDILQYERRKYKAAFLYLTDEALLDELHWSNEQMMYADYGLHSQKVKLRIPPSDPAKARQPQQNSRPEMTRHVMVPPKYGYVDMFGYVSLFPMLLGILRPDSKRLVSIIEKLDDPKLLWTPYGLRSLATNAPLYNTRNTEHDPPYWRSPVWININFLAIKSLRSYSQQGGEIGALAHEKYTKLRQAVIDNIMRQYWRTGYVWEQYNDITGEGKGCRPFTGWSGLVVLVMAEEY